LNLKQGVGRHIQINYYLRTFFLSPHLMDTLNKTARTPLPLMDVSLAFIFVQNKKGSSNDRFIHPSIQAKHRV